VKEDLTQLWLVVNK